MKRKTFVWSMTSLMLIVAMIIGVLWYEFCVKETYFTSNGSSELQLIIDPGHGGEDGGAISLSGVKESDINLSIALKLDQILGLFGESAILLRSEDTSLHDASAQTIREKKIADLAYRVATIEETDNGVVFSIHQNTFESPQYSGAQVFYGSHENSLPLAELAQETLRLSLDQDNTRVATAISESIYLMNHITCPAILIECGFLSHPEEEGQLITDSYQTQVATALFLVWIQYQSNFHGITEERVLT